MLAYETADEVWRRPDRRPTLPPDEVHIWRASLDCPKSLDRYHRTLAAGERQRAERFHFQRDRDHFIAARGILRAILGGYLGEPPESFSFDYGPEGKPYLASPNPSDLRFNLSHSRSLALYGVTRGRDLGIDVEAMRDDVMQDRLAERFFTTDEAETLRKLPESQQVEGFFNCWTRKEAYMKARGKGLSMPLDGFDVSLAPGEPAALLRAALVGDDASRWTMLALEPGSDFKAAIVVEAGTWKTCYWQWPVLPLRGGR